jgi:hypothetical protein
LLAQRKWTKRKGARRLDRYAISLRFSQQSALVELAIANDALAQTGDSLGPIAAAMLGGAYGFSSVVRVRHTWSPGVIDNPALACIKQVIHP